MRVRKDVDGLEKYAASARSLPAFSRAIVALCRMRRTEEAAKLVEGRKVSSIAVRELAHAHAQEGSIIMAMEYLDQLVDHVACQLLVEVMALALTSVIDAEKYRLRKEFLRGVETNEAVQKVIHQARTALPKLGKYRKAVLTLASRESKAGLTEAFNELLKSCGRAHAVPESFCVLEWMEVMQVPKDNYTYEAIGMNTVKRVGLLRKVWDLPNAPEECGPEVVFAGRSNVGKSSLVNMLLGRTALAPTSSQPGKTKTMDFFDVNAGHPALPRFRLVDVPGLGFAKATKDMRMRWIGLIGGYFVQRQNLKVVFHLLDASLCEILPADRDLWKLLAQAGRSDFELCICLTKADCTLPSQMERFATTVRQALRKEGSNMAMNARIFACSARSKLGKDTLWRKVWSVVSDQDMTSIMPEHPGGQDDRGLGEIEGNENSDTQLSNHNASREERRRPNRRGGGKSRKKELNVLL